MKWKRLIYHKNKCIGCRLCEIQCVSSHSSNNSIQPLQARIRILRDHDKQKEKALYCHLCKNTPCINACQYDAIVLNEEFPAIRVIKENCIGCGKCIEACPFDAPILNPTTNTILICDLCDGNPACVEICPEGALDYK